MSTTSSTVADDRPPVVMFGSYDEDRHPRVAVLREGLAGSGCSVAVINEPLGASTADKVAAARSPFAAARFAALVVRSWWRLFRRGRRTPAPEVVVVGYLGHLDVHLARLLWPDAVIVLDHLVGLADTVRDRGLDNGATYRLLDLVDRAALRRADVVLVDTEEQRDLLPPSIRPKAIVVAVGATAVWSQQSRPAPPPPLRVCFVGLFTPLHGAPVIGRALELLHERGVPVRATMVGAGQELAATRSAAGAAVDGIEWIDWVPAAELPPLVASHHVSLGIFGTTPKALRVVPTKVYQGLAAGTTVVTSDTPPQRRALGAAARYVAPGDPGALADELAALAGDLAARADVPQDQSSSPRFDPPSVVGALVESLTPRPPDLSRGPALSPAAWLRFDTVREHLEVPGGSRVLEIGPGRGAIAARLAAAGYEYTGVELSDESRESTASLLAPINEGARVVSSLSEIPREEHFDLLCAFEVLEHIEDDAGALTDWVGRIREGGDVLLSVPAWPERFSLTDTEVGHLRRYTPEQLADVATAAGLIDIDVRLYGFPLGYGLEWARDRLARRSQAQQQESTIDRTKRSGAWYQPPRWANSAVQLATWPFRLLQRRVPERGTGLVLHARVPAK